MKRLDKLILFSFLGPFVLTFVVVDFILLTTYMLKYFDEFVGKNLGAEVFAELIFYFCINMSPKAFPLAVLLSTLMTYGNLGEHFEITAIKSAGISLVRTFVPIFSFVVLLTFGVFYSNNNLVPRANLKAYQLLYDIRQTKPAMDIKPGVFYNGLPNYSIKVNKKYPDDITLKEIIIYDHSEGRGNTTVVMADSGKMYTFSNDRYLMLELYDGTAYQESIRQRVSQNYDRVDPFTRNSFNERKIVFSLASFDFQQTNEELFATNRLMKNIKQLTSDIDSMKWQIFEYNYRIYASTIKYFEYHLKGYYELPQEMLERKLVMDSIFLTKSQDSSVIVMLQSQYEVQAKAIREMKPLPSRKELPMANLVGKSKVVAAVSWQNRRNRELIIKAALAKARQTKNTVQTNLDRIVSFERNIDHHEVEKYRKLAEAVACLIMFTIGAPLGAIIKRGGLGFPVIISIVFYVFYYVVSLTTQKWVREGLMDPILGVWMANLILFPLGLVFLRQARNDVRLFEADYYRVVLSRWLSKVPSQQEEASLAAN